MMAKEYNYKGTMNVTAGLFLAAGGLLKQRKKAADNFLQNKK